MTVKTDVPYVVATASIAQRMNEECAHHIRSVNQLIESRVSEGDGLHVVGTANPSEDGWLCDRYSMGICLFDSVRAILDLSLP